MKSNHLKYSAYNTQLASRLGRVDFCRTLSCGLVCLALLVVGFIAEATTLHPKAEKEGGVREDGTVTWNTDGSVTVQGTHTFVYPASDRPLAWEDRLKMDITMVFSEDKNDRDLEGGIKISGIVGGSSASLPLASKPDVSGGGAILDVSYVTVLGGKGETIYSVAATQNSSDSFEEVYWNETIKHWFKNNESIHSNDIVSLWHKKASTWQKLGKTQASFGILDYEVEMYITLTVTDATVHEIKIPGYGELYPWDLMGGPQYVLGEGLKSYTVKGTNFDIRRLQEGTQFGYSSRKYTIDQVNALGEGYFLSEFATLTKAGGYIKVDVPEEGYFFAVARSVDRFTADWQGSHYGLQTELIGRVFDATPKGYPTEYFNLYKVTPPANTEKVLMKMTTEGPFIAANEVVIGRPVIDDVNRYLSDMTDHDPIVCAHRGYWEEAGVPENHKQAFDKAIAVGSTDMLELDVKVTKDKHVILFHDDIAWRLLDYFQDYGLSSEDVNNLEKIEVKNLNWNSRTNQSLQFINPEPGQEDKMINITMPALKNANVRDRFGNNLEETLMTLEDALVYLKGKDIIAALDKVMGNVERAYESALKADMEDRVLFKGNMGSYTPEKLGKKGYLMKQIFYTPYMFSETPELESRLTFFEDKYSNNEWNIPGYEFQIKTDYDHAPAFRKAGNQYLMSFINSLDPSRLIGITPVIPSRMDGVDVKALFDNCTEADLAIPEKSASCSNYDWRADLDFTTDHVGANYWITDRPKLTIEYLKARGMINNN